ncbi:hypothetical protein B0H21DRAFT_894769 [Amylocystis lapponica]|nr:hypothetical protein B0H21DRAFT_894769 [Amylocystis lapponica]
MPQWYRDYTPISIAGQSIWLADVYPPPLTFPTSNVRAEPIRRPPAQQAPPEIPSPSVPCASVPLSIPSVSQSASQILFTAENPIVVQYINKLADWKENGVLPSRLVGVDRPRIKKKQRMSEACWIVSVANVNPVLDRTSDLPEIECMCVLALAALSLFHSPTAVAFSVLWGDGVYSQTAEVVQKVCYDLKPCRIEPPFCWLGLPQMKFYFRRNIKPLVPKAAPKPAHRKAEKSVVPAAPVQAPPPEPREVGGRLLRGRKVPEATGAPSQPELSEKAKGKQKASDDAESQPSAPKLKTRQAKREYITAMVPPADAIPSPAVDVTAGVGARSQKLVIRIPAPTHQRRDAGSSTLPPLPLPRPFHLPPSMPLPMLTLGLRRPSQSLRHAVRRVRGAPQRALGSDGLTHALPPAPTAVPARSRSSSALTGTSGTVVDSEGTAVDEGAEHGNAQPSAKALGKRKAVGTEEDAQGPPAKRVRQKRPPLAVTVALAQMKGTPGVQTRARSRGAGRA